MAKTSKKSKAAKRERRERRFEPKSAASPALVMLAGGLGAAALGAGTFGQFAATFKEGAEPVAYAPWILAGGAVSLAIAIWFGTSGESALRVGDPGLAFEKSGTVRLPWHAISKIAWTDGGFDVVGNDEHGSPRTVRVSTKSHGQAAAWLLREARERIPNSLEVPEEFELVASENAGELLTVEPLQVVGKRCADSEKIIAFEPDARVCKRCERVYHKDHTPETCACGAAMAS